MFTNGKIIVYEFMIKFYSYLYFCQSYSWNKDYLINYSQWIHLAGNCHRWSTISRYWYNDHRSWKCYRFPSLHITRYVLKEEGKTLFLLPNVKVEFRHLYSLQKRFSLCSSHKINANIIVFCWPTGLQWNNTRF